MTADFHSAVERAAWEYVQGHVSVIPLVCDGSKAPALPTGGPQVYAERLPTREEIHEWFAAGNRGIGMKTGKVSLGLEGIDFDMHQLLDPVLSLLPMSLVNKLSIIETPGGWHIVYRCREICGNRHLAMWEEPQSLSEKLNGHRQNTGFQDIGKGVRIETRGEGGYLVADGSPLAVHKSGLPYCHAFGYRPPHFQEITPDERKTLWQACATFDCPAKPQVHAKVKKAKREIQRERYGEYQANGDEPWIWYDLNGDPSELLRKHGWQSSDSERWTRPGKTFGVSAMLGANDEGVEVLTVFSTSAGPIAPIHGEKCRKLGPFNLLTALEFGGDRSRAAKYVRTELMRL